MKRYTDPELEVVSFEIEDVTNSGPDNEVSGGDDSPIWGGNSVKW